MLCDVTEELCPHPRGGDVEANVNARGGGASFVRGPCKDILCNSCNRSLAVVRYLLARVRGLGLAVPLPADGFCSLVDGFTRSRHQGF